LLGERYVEIRPMARTWYEKEGILREQRSVLRKQLEKRFGSLTPSALTRLEAASEDELDRIAVQLLDAQSPTEVGLGEEESAT
jgi:hypothetical protein